MSREKEIRNVRLQKIDRLKDAGMDPYVLQTKRDVTLHDAYTQFAAVKKKKKNGLFNVCGRIMSVRGAGKIMFVKLFDGTGEMQMVLRVDDLGPKKMKFFAKNFDAGDFVQFRGKLGVTKTKEKSLFIAGYKMLTKSLLPLPDEHYGLSDEETRYRKRYLDILMNKDVSSRFVLRSEVIKEIRSFLDEKDFMEIETPILQSQAGGAMAETFNTHHNDYDMPMVLRIALELQHKMLMAGGYGAVYEIGKNFRNEGSDPTHIQEFTMLEWYAAYHSLEENIKWTEQMIKKCAKLTGKKEFKVTNSTGKTVTIDLSGKWKRVEFKDLVKKNAKLDITKAERPEIVAKAIEWGMSTFDAKKTGDANLLDFIYKKSSRNKIIHPTFVMNYPGDLKPLAQQNEDGTASVCQLIIAGAEITNQYTELVDPLRQRELLESQAKAKAGGDAEAMEVDEDFLTAMEYGMPPMTGFGMGIDRLVAILSEQDNLRETIFFPILKPVLSKKDKKKKKK